MNPNVRPELADILAHCLAEDPAQRYPDCHALAEDLNRHLHDLPLRGVRNRPAERWRKWRRRRPFGLLLLGLVMGFWVASSFAGINFLRVNEERRTQAESALVEGQEWQRKGQHDAAIRRFLAGKDLAETTYGAQALRDQLARRLHGAERLQTADELSKAVSLMRFCALQDHTPRRLEHVLEAAGRNVWAKRALLMDRSASLLEPAVERNIDNELQELVLLWSDLQTRLAPPTHKSQVRAEVEKVLDQAETLFGPSFGLQLARGQIAGKPHPADGLKPHAAWEFCAVGRIALREGDTDDAVRNFQQAFEREPLEFVPNLHISVGWMRQHKYAQAAQGLSYCLGKDPSSECLLLRGETYAALGNLDRAKRDLDLAVEKNPSLAMAYQLRGKLLLRLGRSEDAAKDFELARQLRD